MKRPGGKLSQAQKTVRDALQAAGGVYIVCSDVSDLNAALVAS